MPHPRVASVGDRQVAPQSVPRASQRCEGRGTLRADALGYAIRCSIGSPSSEGAGPPIYIADTPEGREPSTPPTCPSELPELSGVCDHRFTIQCSETACWISQGASAAALTQQRRQERKAYKRV